MKNNFLFRQVITIIITYILIIAVGSCTGDSESGPAPVDPADTSIIDTAPYDTVLCDTIPVFRIIPITSEPILISMPTAGESETSAVFVSAGDSVTPSDTLVTYDDLFRRMQSERIQMELDLALIHFNSGDSTASCSLRIDSLTACLQSLAAPSCIFSLSEGTITVVTVSVGDTVSRGDTLLLMISSEISHYGVEVPMDLELHHWPERAGSSILLEHSTRSAVYSGVHEEIEDCFSRIITVPRAALYEDGLVTFVITICLDTIPVLCLADISGADAVIIPDYPVNEPLLRRR